MGTTLRPLVLACLATLALNSASAQTPGSCALGTAEARLFKNNVSANLFNTGSLFFGGSTTNGGGYYVPVARQRSPLFTSGLWVGGMVNGALRFAGARYTDFNFWPGPLLDGARLPDPTSCAAYDRLYSVRRADIDRFEAGEAPTDDLRDWPAALGAPVLDGDGVPGNYNLAGGDRPDIVGDQGVWWVMNDVGNVHVISGTDPLGIEVQVLAYAFGRAGPLAETTFYRYRIINRSRWLIEETYVGFWADPDLGNPSDDYVGFDESLGMWYTYNADEVDEGPQGYGIPPALGFDFIQGPVVGTDTLAATAFGYFRNGGPLGPPYDPSSASSLYLFMQGLWGEGTSMRAHGDGYDEPSIYPITTFAYHGDPVTGVGWSERFPGSGSPIPAGDRRGVMSSGPFTLAPGQMQEVTIAIVYAQGADHLDSITQLRRVSRAVQQAHDRGYPTAQVPAVPRCADDTQNGCLRAAALDGEAVLVWGYPEESPSYLAQYAEIDPVARAFGVAESTYEFEGFYVYRYETSAPDAPRERIATLDRVNGVLRIVDTVFDPEFVGEPYAEVFVGRVVAEGTDAGVAFHLHLPGLTNQTDYHYGVSSYVYNAESSPKVVESAATRITVRPQQLSGGDRVGASVGDALPVTVLARAGGGEVSAEVVDPLGLTGDAYEVRFIDAPGVGTTYSVLNTRTGAVLLDGPAYAARRRRAMPTDGAVAVLDGFELSVTAGAMPPEPGDMYRIETGGLAPERGSSESALASLDEIAVVPNPYLGASGYEAGSEQVIRFTNLPLSPVRIRIFTVGGTLVRTLHSDGSSRSLEWDVRTTPGRPAASGMYLVRVEVAGVGERTLRLGLVQRQPE